MNFLKIFVLKEPLDKSFMLIHKMLARVHVLVSFLTFQNFKRNNFFLYNHDSVLNDTLKGEKG